MKIDISDIKRFRDFNYFTDLEARLQEYISIQELYFDKFETKKDQSEMTFYNEDDLNTIIINNKTPYIEHCYDEAEKRILWEMEDHLPNLKPNEQNLLIKSIIAEFKLTKDRIKVLKVPKILQKSKKNIVIKIDQINEYLNSKISSQTKESESVIKGFTLNEHIDKRIVSLLWKELVSKKFIDPIVSISVFNSAFEGLPLSKHLKIKWINCGRNNLVNKQSLFYLINCLVRNEIIIEDTDNRDLFKRMEFIFCDKTNKALTALAVSNTNASKFTTPQTPDQKELESIIVSYPTV